MQTQRTAAHVGWLDRGVLAPGYLGDVNVIDLDVLNCRAPVIVHDLPAGGRRLMQTADGYRYTVKSGAVTFEDGVHTGALPGPPRAREPRRALTVALKPPRDRTRYLGPEHYWEVAHMRRIIAFALVGGLALTACSGTVRRGTKSLPAERDREPGRRPRRRPRRSSTATTHTPGSLAALRGRTLRRARHVVRAPTAARGSATGKVTNSTPAAVRYRIYVSFLAGDTTVGITETDAGPVRGRRRPPTGPATVKGDDGRAALHPARGARRRLTRPDPRARAGRRPAPPDDGGPPGPPFRVPTPLARRRVSRAELDEKPRDGMRTLQNR